MVRQEGFFLSRLVESDTCGCKRSDHRLNKRSITNVVEDDRHHTCINGQFHSR